MIVENSQVSLSVAIQVRCWHDCHWSAYAIPAVVVQDGREITVQNGNGGSTISNSGRNEHWGSSVPSGLAQTPQGDLSLSCRLVDALGCLRTVALGQDLVQSPGRGLDVRSLDRWCDRGWGHLSVWGKDEDQPIG